MLKSTSDLTSSETRLRASTCRATSRTLSASICGAGPQKPVWDQSARSFFFCTYGFGAGHLRWLLGRRSVQLRRRTSGTEKGPGRLRDLSGPNILLPLLLRRQGASPTPLVVGFCTLWLWWASRKLRRGCVFSLHTPTATCTYWVGPGRLMRTLQGWSLRVVRVGPTFTYSRGQPRGIRKTVQVARMRFAERSFSPCVESKRAQTPFESAGPCVFSGRGQTKRPSRNAGRTRSLPGLFFSSRGPSAGEAFNSHTASRRPSGPYFIFVRVPAGGMSLEPGSLGSFPIEGPGVSAPGPSSPYSFIYRPSPTSGVGRFVCLGVACNRLSSKPLGWKPRDVNEKRSGPATGVSGKKYRNPAASAASAAGSEISSRPTGTTHSLCWSGTSKRRGAPSSTPASATYPTLKLLGPRNSGSRTNYLDPNERPSKSYRPTRSSSTKPTCTTSGSYRLNCRSRFSVTVAGEYCIIQRRDTAWLRYSYAVSTGRPWWMMGTWSWLRAAHGTSSTPETRHTPETAMASTCTGSFCDRGPACSCIIATATDWITAGPTSCVALAPRTQRAKRYARDGERRNTRASTCTGRLASGWLRYESIGSSSISVSSRLKPTLLLHTTKPPQKRGASFRSLTRSTQRFDTFGCGSTRRDENVARSTTNPGRTAEEHPGRRTPRRGYRSASAIEDIGLHEAGGRLTGLSRS